MPETKANSPPVTRLDFQGLIFGRQFSSEGRAHLLERLPERLTVEGTDEWIWAHLDLVDRRALRWLTAQNLPPLTMRAFQSEDTRPRIEEQPGLIAGVLVEMRSEPSRQLSRARLLRFAAGHNWLITARHHPLEDIDTLRARLDRGLVLRHPLEVLAQFVELSVDRFQREIDGMLASLNFIEEVVIERGGTDASARIAEIRRNAVTMHREMSQSKGAISRLVEESANIAPPAAVRDVLSVDLQKAEALHSELQSIGDRARLIKDEMASNLAMDMNQSLYIISMISALLLPPSLIFGLFGINVGGLPFLNHDYGFWAVVTLGGLSSLLVFLMLRRRG